MTSLHIPRQFSLKRRILSAGSWSLVGYALSYPLRLGSSMVMTRLLVPEMFGVMAIAMMIMTGLVMFSDLGLRQNIVQSHRGEDPEYLNTAWVVQIMRGALLWVVALCVSLFIFIANRLGMVPTGSVYGDPQLPYVVALVSISSVIQGFQSTKFAEASRRLSLARVTQIQIAAQIIGLAFMIVWVLMDRSIWALVGGSICSAFITTLLSHIWLPGISNRWHWDHSAFHEILHFGKWMFLSSILGFFANSSDRLLLGGFVDSSTLGIYSIAFTFYSSIYQILNRLISDVSYSAFSEVARERASDLKQSLYRFHIITAAFTYFCSGILIVSGSFLISLLYDRRYEQAGWMLEILAVGLLAVPFNLTIHCLLARGLPRVFTYLIAIRVAVTFALVPPAFYHFGVAGALIAIVVGQLAVVPPTIYYSIKFNLFDLSKELLLLPIFFLALFLAKGLTLFAAHW